MSSPFTTTVMMRHLGGLDEASQFFRDQYDISEEAQSHLEHVLRDLQADPTRPHVTDPSELKKMTVVRLKGDASTVLETG